MSEACMTCLRLACLLRHGSHVEGSIKLVFTSCLSSCQSLIQDSGVYTDVQLFLDSRSSKGTILQECNDL